ncbi:hypothetical protein ACU21_06590 [Actinobaculum suis]|nr:hypothetical protein ACU20_07205 [Actinobaculum suis]OCA94378.1 hypothetical protein ACU21_06590 [Actinobaculum suis]
MQIHAIYLTWPARFPQVAVRKRFPQFAARLRLVKPVPVEIGDMQTITLRRPAEALAVIPHILGFYPHNHLIIFGAQCAPDSPAAPSGSVGPVMKINLSAGPVLPETRLAIANAVQACAMQRVIAAIYTEDLGNFVGTEIYKTAMHAITHAGERLDEMWAASSAPWSLDVFLADKDGYFDVESGEFAAWETLSESPAAASFVYEGSAPLEKEPSRAIRRHTSAQRQKATTIRNESRRRKENRRQTQMWNTLLARAEKLADEATIEVTAEEAGIALAGLMDTTMRDQVISLALSPIPLTALENIAVGPTMEEIKDKAPHIQRAKAVISLCDAVAAYAPDDDPCPLATCAYIAWWIGMTSLAGQRAREALRADRDYTLANLVARALEWASLPPWLSTPGGEDREGTR